MTKEEYQEKLNKIYNNRYKIISDCKLTTDKVTILDTYCGNTFTIIANEFTRTRVQKRNKEYCPCCRPSKALTEEFCQSELNKLTKNRISIIEYGGSSHSTSKFRCNECGYEWTYNYHGLVGNLKERKTNNSWGCARCSNKKKKLHNEFVEQVKELYGDAIEIVGVYVNTNTPIATRCNICNYIYNPYPVDLLYKYKQKNHTHGCPKCYEKRSDSIAIIFIKNILEENNILYETEIKFDSCKYKNKLPFDIAIQKDNGDYILIEYDGDQHETGWKGNKNNLEIQQKRDEIKNKFCLDNDIPLLRLNYKHTWNEMEDMLYNFLKDNNIGSL